MPAILSGFSLKHQDIESGAQKVSESLRYPPPSSSGYQYVSPFKHVEPSSAPSYLDKSSCVRNHLSRFKFLVVE